MTKERFLEIVKILEDSNDLIVEEYNGGLNLDFNDFEGFTEDWDEVYRNIVNPSLYEELENFLDEILDWDFYGVGEYKGIKLHVGYTSYDI